MRDQNLPVLQNRVSIELDKINCLLRKNKLALNYKKTSYILVHEQPQNSVSENFKLIINDQNLIRNNIVKIFENYYRQKLNGVSAPKVCFGTAYKIRSAFLWNTALCNKRCVKHAVLCVCMEHIMES